MGKIVAGISFLAISMGIVSADEFLVQITKVEGSKITGKYVKIDKDAKKGGGFGKGGFGKDMFKDAESKTFTCTKDVKVTKKGKFDFETKSFGESTPIEDGLKNKMFTDATEEKPLVGRITTNDDGKGTEISVGGGFGGGKGGKGGFKKKNDTSN